MKKCFITLIFIFSCSKLTLAAEFPWFNVYGFEGWAEISNNLSSDKRINVLPQLYGPSGVGWFGGPQIETANLISVQSDGTIKVKYLIISDPSVLPADFKKLVYEQIKGTGFPIQNFDANFLNNYQINFVKASNIVVSLLINDNVVQQRTLNQGFIPSKFTGEFNIDNESEYYSYIRNGDFKIEMNFKFPYTNFSGLTINLNQSAMTDLKIESFRQVIQETSVTGGSFLIWDWRRRIIRNIEKERISNSATSQYVTNLDIVLRDPDETTFSILDNLLGVAKLSAEQFKQRHEALINQAISQNNPKLGDLSRQYIQAVENNDEQKQLDVLKALLALKSGDIATFIASGIRFSSNDAFGNSTYHSIVQTSINSGNIENYTSTIIKTIDYNFTLTLEKFSLISQAIIEAESAQRYNLFGVLYPTHEIISRKLIESVNTNNIINARLCLNSGGNPNIEENYSRKHILTLAIEKNNLAMVNLLLKSGANPNLRNIHGETPIVVAKNRGNQQIINIINGYKDHSGSITLSIQKPEILTIDNLSIKIENLHPEIMIANKTPNLIRTNQLKLFPNGYFTEVNFIAKIFIENYQNSQVIHNRLLNNGFGFNVKPNGIEYFKTINLYDYFRVINNVENDYKFRIYFDFTRYDLYEENNKHIHPQIRYGSQPTNSLPGSFKF